MISCPDGVPTQASPSVEELLVEFQLFRSASESLEKAYGELKQQAERVDHELAKANQSLRQGIEEREGILGALPLGVFRRTDAGLDGLNPQAARLLARVEEHVLAELLTNRETATLIARDREGQAMTLRVTSVQLGDDGGVLEFVDDETEIDAMRSEIDRLARLSSLSELALGVAHEVRNPLNGVAGFAGMLKRCPDSPKAAHWAARIEEGAWRVDRIVTELLAFARPKDRVDPLLRSLPAWLAEARAELPDLEVDLDPDASACQALGSPQALGKVFSNLLRNAQEAGATHVTIKALQLDEDRIRLDFQDDGAGIPAELQEKLFDPFVGSKEQGTGLGLAFCVRALEAMDGSIRLVPCQQGAHFSIELGGATR